MGSFQSHVSETCDFELTFGALVRHVVRHVLDSGLDAGLVARTGRAASTHTRQHVVPCPPDGALEVLPVGVA